MTDEKWHQRRPSSQQLRETRRWAVPLMVVGAVLLVISLVMVYV